MFCLANLLNQLLVDFITKNCKRYYKVGQLKVLKIGASIVYQILYININIMYHILDIIIYYILYINIKYYM